MCHLYVCIVAHCPFAVKHDGAVTWLEASDRCSKNGLEFKENVLKEFDVLQGNVFWLGKAIYRKTSEWIEILG